MGLDVDAESTSASWLRSSRGRAFRALSHEEFRLVWSTFIIGQLGFWIAFLALQALMADLTDSDGTWIGLLFFVNFIPMLIFTPFAGMVADRYDRKRILVIGFLVLTVVSSTLAVVTLADYAEPVTLLPFAFAVGTVFAFNAPASHSLIATVVPPSDLSSAVSLQSVGSNLSRVIGPTLAAPILALTNEDVAFVLYAVAAIAVAVLLSRWTPTPRTHEPEAGSFVSRLRGGWEHARERPPALAALTMLSVSSLTAGAYFSMLPIVAEETFDRGSSGLTTLAAISGIGSVAGAVATGLRDTPPTMSRSAALVTAFGVSVVVFGIAPTWPLTLLSSTLLGAFYFWAMTSINALLQSLTDDAKRGRLMALFIVAWAGLVPIGGLWQGAFADAFGVRPTVVLAGLLTAGSALTMLVLTRRRRATVLLEPWRTG